MPPGDHYWNSDSGSILFKSLPLTLKFGAGKAPRMSVSDFNGMIGYPNSSPSNGRHGVIPYHSDCTGPIPV